MKKIFCVLLLSILVMASSDLAARAQDTTACNTHDRGIPNNTRFQNLNAVGLLISDFSRQEDILRCHGKEEDCAKEQLSKSVSDVSSFENATWIQAKASYYKTLYQIYSPPVQIDNIVEVFRKKIHEQIFPYMNADANCQVPELAVFKIGQAPDELYLQDFMKDPNRLLIVVQIQFVGLQHSVGIFSLSEAQRSLDTINKYGPPVAILTLHYIRSDSSALNYVDGIRDARQIVIPLNLPEDELAKHIGWLADNILVQTTRFHPNEGAPRMKNAIDEALKSKPPMPMIPIPKPLPE